MPLYRYRTCVLSGPWRSSRSEATRDALRAGQAEADRLDQVKWRVPGEIEERDGDSDRADQSDPGLVRTTWEDSADANLTAVRRCRANTT